MRLGGALAQWGTLGGAQAPPMYSRNSAFIREGDIIHKLNIGINYKLNICIGMIRSSYKILIRSW